MVRGHVGTLRRVRRGVDRVEGQTRVLRETSAGHAADAHRDARHQRAHQAGDSDPVLTPVPEGSRGRRPEQLRRESRPRQGADAIREAQGGDRAPQRIRHEPRGGARGAEGPTRRARSRGPGAQITTRG